MQVKRLAQGLAYNPSSRNISSECHSLNQRGRRKKGDRDGGKAVAGGEHSCPVSFPHRRSPSPLFREQSFPGLISQSGCSGGPGVGYWVKHRCHCQEQGQGEASSPSATGRGGTEGPVGGTRTSARTLEGLRCPWPVSSQI